MPNIIISYRRADSDVIAGRIRDRLAGHYGDDSVFMDIDSIPFGLDFREHIKTALAENDILIAVIGPNWTGGSNNPRIFEETDPVRIEVETALQKGTPVIPVLVAGATMPKTSELPGNLKDLAFRNAATVDGGRDFHQHMDRLIRSMDGLLANKSSSAHHKPGSTNQPFAKKAASRFLDWRPIGLIVVLLGVIAGLVYFFTRSTTPSQQAATQPAVQTNQQALSPQPPVQTSQQTTPPQSPVQTSQQQANPANSGSQATTQTLPAVAPPCARTSSSNAFYDNFKSHEIGWQPPIGEDVPTAGKVSYYDSNGLAIVSPEKLTFTVVYTPLFFSDINACVRIMNPPAEIAEKALVSAGLVFWFQDGSNYYAVAEFLEPPSVQLYRNVNRKFMGAGVENTATLKTGPSAINDLQVVTKGNIGAQYLNGKKIGEFKGQPPATSPVGLIAQSGPQQKNKWTFVDFSVSENQ